MCLQWCVSPAVDGVCLQTSESIGCAEELGLPTVVVLNKIDLLPEEQKSQVTFVLWSAITWSITFPASRARGLTRLVSYVLNS